jgi:protein gp37
MGQEKYAGGFDNVVIHPMAWQEVKKWKKPCKVFLNSMSDTFHKDVPWWYIKWMFRMMNHYPQHTWQILTKRAGLMAHICTHPELDISITRNIWMGVTVENQDNIGRIEHLKAIDAKTKFVSFEPLLGPIDLSEVIQYNVYVDLDEYIAGKTITDQDSFPVFPFQWAIIGSESGPGARPMEEEW